ncbi:PRA1 family protein 3 [Osmia bicornis bicornis]|uniref:PRA1 family protein 3 n=1 Tax=Osmia bicornis bicornis TaxID=1437191 RepID=UPI0010F6AB6E|nr:PRA1 family protein 3 [Osmia bicornis bicornis]
MDKAKSLSDTCELPPLRSLNDFLLESSRFQLPNFRDLEKWGNRVVNNLVYYQTNYVYMTIAIILIVASVNPMKMIIGLSAMTAIWGACIYLFSERESLLKLKRSYPQIGIILTVICAGFVVYTINSVVFLLFSILLSVCVTFVHASLRLRSLKNKVVNKLEGMGLERTPMGAVLNYFEDATGIAFRKQTTTVQSLH